MELVFWWDDTFFGALRPRCSGDGATGQGQLLAGLLTDDGGVGLDATLAWLDAGIDMARAVRLAQLEGGCWDRETLGARIGRDGVDIAWLLHEDEVERVSLDRFERALSAWRSFLSEGPPARIGARVSVAA